jgi:hypothetical protein
VGGKAVPGFPEEGGSSSRAREPENVSAPAAACRQTITLAHLISDPIIGILPVHLM